MLQRYRLLSLLILGGLNMAALEASENKNEKLKKTDGLATQGKKWRELATTERITTILDSIKNIVPKERGISHYRYLTGNSAYSRDTYTKDGTTPETNFINSFRGSAQRGSELFWGMILPDGKKEQKAPEAEILEQIIDLVNFILFSASLQKPDLKDPLFVIYSSEEITSRFFEFFKSAPTGEDEKEESKFLQADDGWFSVHLHRGGQAYRDQWPAQGMFKSFAFHTNPATPDYFEFCPHTQSAAKPDSPEKRLNVIPVSLYELLAGYLMLVQEGPQLDVANFMGAAAQSAASSTTSKDEEQKIDARAAKLLEKVQKSQDPKCSLYLTPFIEQLTYDYRSSLQRAALAGDIIIAPSNTQLTDSLKQYTAGNVTNNDSESFLTHAIHGADVFQKLLEGEDFATQIAQVTEELEEKESAGSTNRGLFQEYMRAIIDINLFCYLLGIYLRDDGIGSAAFVTGIVGAPQVHTLLVSFLTFLKENAGLSLGTTKDWHAANYYGYYRAQSHGFVDAFGIDIHATPEATLFTKNYTPSSPIPHTQPLLFPLHWNDKAKYGIGAQFHLLIGNDPKIDSKFYSKWESAGLNSGGLADPGEWLEHAGGAIASQARKRPMIRNLFKMLSDDEPQFNKERVPEIIQTYIEQTITTDGLKKAKEAAKDGISALYKRCDKLKDGAALKRLLEEKYDHPDLRKGREIIIAPERDDSIVWIDYFVSEDDDVKKTYELFSRIKHQIIDLASGRTVEMKPQENIKEKEEEEFISIEYKESPLQKTFDLYKDFDRALRNEKNIPQKIKEYLTKVAKILEKVKGLEDEKQRTFVRQNARIMFDLRFADIVEERLNEATNRAYTTQAKS